jgi:hypothetical protein
MEEEQRKVRVISEIWQVNLMKRDLKENSGVDERPILEWIL